MIRVLALLTLAVVVGIALLPRLAQVLAWVMAFLILLMGADLLLSMLRRSRWARP